MPNNTEQEATNHPDENLNDSAVIIEGIPFILQKHTFWCGYTSLAMVLQYYGHQDITPERVFEQLHGEEAPAKELLNPKPRPDADTLASLARELTRDSSKKLEARIISDDDYVKLNMEPHDVLQRFVKAGVPCIVRTPGHFKIVSGFNTGNDTYRFHDPFRGILEYETDYFKSGWAEKDMGHGTRDARNLLLAIYPDRKAS